MKNKKLYLIYLLLLPIISFSQVKDINRSNVIRLFNDWQQVTYLSLKDNLNDIIKEGADSVSVIKNTLPTFKKFLTSSRSECFIEFKNKGYKPFYNLYTSDILIIEIFREDNCHTKVMYIIDVNKEIKYSFIRSCMTKGKTIIKKDSISETIISFVKDFALDFNYKESWQSYTGIMTIIEKGKFKSIPLLYLSDDNINKLNKYNLGLTPQSSSFVTRMPKEHEERK